MLVEMAIADAYAIPFEFVPHSDDRPNDLSGYYQHPTYLELSPGQYTDDTQRAIANCEVLLSNHSDRFSAYAYSAKYIEAYRRDPREGYSRKYQEFLKSVETPEDFIHNIRRTAVSNGSLMGVAPLGFLPNINEVRLAATVQATTTHHPDTAVHAQAIALAVHYMLYRGRDVAGLRPFLFNNIDWRDNTDDRYRWQYLIERYHRDLSAKTTIKASSISAYMVYALETCDKLSEIILDAVQRGGDTDSAAAASVAVASCCPYIDNDIPLILYNRLEPNSQYGLTFLEGLEAQMRDHFLV